LENYVDTAPTIDACRRVAVAKGHKYFAMQNGNACFTGNNNYAAQGKATGECPPNGGPWVNHVYLTNSPAPVTPPVWSRINIPILWSPSGNSIWGQRGLAIYGKVPICPDNLSALGGSDAVIDNNVWGSKLSLLKTPVALPDGSTFNKCFTDPKDFGNTVTSIGNVTNAGFRLDLMDKVTGRVTQPAQGDMSFMYNGPKAAPVRQCKPPMGNPAPIVSGRRYMGCFRDCNGRSLPNYVGQSSSVEECIAKAKAAGYNTSGNQYFGECWAGNNNDWDRQGDAGCCEPLGGGCTQQVYTAM
jgi:hypothetical protein